MLRRHVLRFFAPCILALGVGACVPEPGLDAGTDDAGVEDAGTIRDSGSPRDSGNAQPPSDGGENACPAVSPFSSPLGQSCAEECQLCGQTGCFAPGPSCLFIQCERDQDGDLVWRTLTDSPDGGGACTEVRDGGTSTTDAGFESDAGTADAGTTTDAGATDAGQADAGETDAGETDAGEADAGEADAGETDGGLLGDSGT